MTRNNPGPLLRMGAMACSLLLAASSTGCAFIKTKALPRDYNADTTPPPCSYGRGPAWTDVALASIFALASVGSFGGSRDAPPDQQASGVTLGVGGLLLAGLFTTSAVTGFQRVKTCKAARATWATSLEEKAKAALAKAEAIRAAEEAQRLRERQARIEQMRAQPMVTANLRIANAYADSIFRVKVRLPDSDEEYAVVSNGRIEGHTVMSLPDAIRGRAGQRIKVYVSVMSLGEWRTFGDSEVDMKPGGTFAIRYDWDVATAEFAVAAGWTIQPVDDSTTGQH